MTTSEEVKGMYWMAPASLGLTWISYFILWFGLLFSLQANVLAAKVPLILFIFDPRIRRHPPVIAPAIRMNRIAFSAGEA